MRIEIVEKILRDHTQDILDVMPDNFFPLDMEGRKRIAFKLLELRIQKLHKEVRKRWN